MFGFSLCLHVALPISFVIFAVLQSVLQIDLLKDLTSINVASIKDNLREKVHHRKKKK